MSNIGLVDHEACWSKPCMLSFKVVASFKKLSSMESPLKCSILDLIMFLPVCFQELMVFVYIVLPASQTLVATATC